MKEIIEQIENMINSEINRNEQWLDNRFNDQKENLESDKICVVITEYNQKEMLRYSKKISQLNNLKNEIIMLKKVFCNE